MNMSVSLANFQPTFFPTRELVFKEESEKEFSLKNMFGRINVLDDLIISYISTEESEDLVEDLSNIKSFMCIANWTKREDHRKMSLFLLDRLRTRGERQEMMLVEESQASVLLYNLGLDPYIFLDKETSGENESYYEGVYEGLYESTLGELNIKWNPTNKNLVMSIVSKRGVLLEFADISLRKDPEVVMAAVSEAGFALEFASIDLRNNKQIVLAAVNRTVDSFLSCAGPLARQDKDILLAVVKKKGEALLGASEDLKDDKEVVLVAVKQNPLALRFASMRLRNDQEVVLTAVLRNGMTLEFAGEDMRNDLYVVLKAVLENHEAFQFASKELRKNEKILAVHKEGRERTISWNRAQKDNAKKRKHV